MRAARAKIVNDALRPEIEQTKRPVDAIQRARASIRAGRRIPMDRPTKLLPT